MKEDITLCLTAGGRPQLLRETLVSLLAANGQHFATSIVSNDVGDDETSDIVRTMLPQAQLIHHRVPLGQVRTIDEMYRRVETPLIFHCEDDWEFDPVPFLDDCVGVLDAMENVSGVCVRQSGDHPPFRAPRRSSHERHGSPPVVRIGNVYAIRSRQLEGRRWGGFTFNPTLLRRSFWQDLGGYAQFGSEGKINDECWVRGLSTAYLRPGVCFHIGYDRHVDDPTRTKPSLLRRVRRAVGRAFRRAEQSRMKR